LKYKIQICPIQILAGSVTSLLLMLLLLQKRLMDKKAEKATLVNKIDVKKNRFSLLLHFVWAFIFTV